MLGEPVRNRILQEQRSLHDHRILRRRRRAGEARAIALHRLGRDAMMPGHELATGIEARLDVVCRHRPELAGREVVLAAPDHLDGLA